MAGQARSASPVMLASREVVLCGGGVGRPDLAHGGSLEVRLHGVVSGSCVMVASSSRCTCASQRACGPVALRCRLCGGVGVGCSGRKP